MKPRRRIPQLHLHLRHELRLHSRPHVWPPRLLSILLPMLLVCALLAGAHVHAGEPTPEPIREPALTEMQKKELERAEALSAQAETLSAQGKYREAIPLAEDSRATILASVGKDCVQYAESIDLLAAIYMAAGDYHTAESLFKECIAIRSRVQGARAIDSGRTKSNLGELYREVGEFGMALPLYEEGLDILVSSLGELHTDTAIVRNNLALLNLEMGRYSDAEKLLLQSLQIQVEALGNDDVETATTLNNIGSLYLLMGEFAKGEGMLRQSLAIRRTKLGMTHPYTITTVGNLATVYLSVGEYSTAELLLRQLLTASRQALGETHPITSTVLDNLAFLDRVAHQYQSAESLFLESLAIKRKTLGYEHPRTAITLGNIASLYQEMGRQVDAKKYHTESLSIQLRMLDQYHPDIARSTNRLGRFTMQNGDYQQAERLFLNGLAISRRSLGENHPYAAISMNNLAHLALLQHTPSAALPYATEALTASLNHLPKALPALSGPERLRYVRQLRKTVDVYLTATSEAHADALETWTPLLRVKGQSLLLEAAIARLEQSADPERRAQLYDYRGLSSRVSALERAGKTGQALEEARAALAEVEKKVTAFVAEQLPTSVDPQAVARSLPAHSALVDFHVYDHLIPPPAPGQKESWSRRIIAFVVRPDQPIQRVELGEEAPVAALIGQWREKLQTGSAIDLHTSGQELRNRLWTPLEPLLEGVSSVQLSPDGVLALLPMGALPGKLPGRYLLEDYAISLAPVPQLLAQADAHGRARTPAEALTPEPFPSLLVLGDVDYGASPGSTSPELVSRSANRGSDGSNFAPLPETRLELDAITQRFHRAWPGAEVARFSGAEAIEGRVKPALSSHSILHLSTHGFVYADPTQAGKSPREDMLTGLEGMSSQSPIDPRSRAGLALAGANHPLELGLDDGTLTALEINALDLRNVDLVVMSACETALGTDAGGEGLLGLQRAFQAAGAHTIVSSLWKVDDKATRLLMERFYQNLWTRHLSKREALREAQLWMLRKGSTEMNPDYHGLPGLWKRLMQGGIPTLSPLYWAAFQLAGEG